MVHALSLGGVLYGLWLLLSGFWDNPMLLTLGVLSCAIVAFLAHRMDIADHEGHPIHLTWRACLYWPWLVWEIVKANIDIAKVILSAKMPIQPQVFPTKAHQKTDLGRMIYANSITLTPGTVTIALEETGRLEVHALTDAAADGVKSLEMDLKVIGIEDRETWKEELENRRRAAIDDIEAASADFEERAEKAEEAMAQIAKADEQLVELEASEDIDEKDGVEAPAPISEPEPEKSQAQEEDQPEKAEKKPAAQKETKPSPQQQDLFGGFTAPDSDDDKGEKS